MDVGAVFLLEIVQCMSLHGPEPPSLRRLMDEKRTRFALSETSACDPQRTFAPRHTGSSFRSRNTFLVIWEAFHRKCFQKCRSGYACACRKSNPDILVVQPAENWAAKNVPGPLDGARDRRILLQ